MRVLIAPSGYKECLNPEEVSRAIAQGIRRASPDAQVVEMPLIDGGEGTARTLARITGGYIHDLRVTGPMGTAIDSHFALLGGTGPKTAVVELAAAAGIRHVPLSGRNPLQTTSIGVGELMRGAIEAGAERLIVGCGDSGVNDGGAGLLQLLGVRLLDRNGALIQPTGAGLARLERVDSANLDPRLSQAEILVACNTKNILTGPNGVARLFGPQKGASLKGVEDLARIMDHYSVVVERATGINVRLIPGGGASGGVGAALHAFLGAKLLSRFELLLPYFPLDQELLRADLVITAEGGLDYKTTYGKIPAEVGARGAAAGVPVIVLAGALGERPEAVLPYGVSAYFSTIGQPESLAAAMSKAEENISVVAEHVMRTFLAGASYGGAHRV